jgi:hypothetical protein
LLKTGEAEDFLAAVGIALLVGVSVIVILKIFEELLKANKSVDKETVFRKLREAGYNV